MDGGPESTPPASDGDASSSASKERMTDDYTRLLLAPVRWRSNKLPIFNTLAFLIGSIAFIIVSEVVLAKRRPLSQTFSDDLNPSCTDFGNSAAERRFAIDLSFGNLTFTQAKIIDATWDTVVGQGGRLLHGWILLGLPTAHVEVGPSFTNILSTQRPSSHNHNDVCLNISKPGQQQWSKYDLRYDASGWKFKSIGSSIWDFVADGLDKGSEDFMNIQRYALTQQFLQIGLNAEEWVHSEGETTLNETLFDDNVPVTLNWFEIGDYSKSQCNNISRYGLHSTLRAVTLGTEGQQSKTQYISNTVNSRPYNESTPWESNWPLSDNESIPVAYWSTFVLNRSVHLGPGTIPYNSTIRLNHTSFTLDAPFLDVGVNCSKSSTFTGLGNCVCYKGQPISPELLSNDRAICNTTPGYVWGFASYLTRVGLILEAVWMACCFVSYPWLLYRSKLLHMEPVKSAKTMRFLLDCSEAVKDDIEVDTKGLHEKEIVRRLEGIRIGFHTDALEGKLKYRITSGLTTKGFSERYSVARSWLYDMTFPVETKLAKRAEKFEKALDKTMPALSRIGNHPIHDTMNELTEVAIGAWRSYSLTGKRKPTANESGMPRPLPFDSVSAINTLRGRAEREKKLEDIGHSFSDALAEMAEETSPNITHEAAVHRIFTALWADLFHDDPPWPTKFTGVKRVDPEGDPNQATNLGVLRLLAPYAMLYPIDSLYLFVPNDLQATRDHIRNTLDTSKHIREFDSLLRDTIGYTYDPARSSIYFPSSAAW
ncbi:hypothetical protein O1611_g1157 [Lasiodiplodia mahajangana]|uniref:Uncharacterized protein n=1 Tax=Lasiodiplodia mahajangana TaxID=1108764 RepID=A0ACC2JYW5_9PEZI|nr:hypothetical protein O1611_g1157 [Lasiodiplodia mahajangana]